LALLANVVFRFKSFSEAARLAQKCGTRRSDIPVRALYPPRRGRGEPIKPRLLYPLVWIPCCDTVN
jgi:hypothetical protein